MKKIKNFKKMLQYKKKEITSALKLLKAYSTRQWLESIKQFNYDYEKRNAPEMLLVIKPEFLVVYADMVLRVSKMKEGINLPSINQCNFLMNVEINQADKPKSLIKLFGLAGIPLLASWQNRFQYNISNMISRIDVLYGKYDDKIKEEIGLGVTDLYIILLAIYGNYHLKKNTYFKKESFLSKDIESTSIINMTNFLKHFSITQEEYIKKAKAENIYEKCFGKFKYLIRYPIIEIEENLYIIPVFEQFIDTLTNNLYFLLLEKYALNNKKSSQTFIDDFSIQLENYVVDLAKYIFKEEQVVRAEELITKKGAMKCEIVITDNDNTLAIEVKKMNFRRDAIVDMDKNHIDNKLKRHIVKAYKQLENTLDNVENINKYGLIVIPDILIGLGGLIPYLKENYGKEARFDDNIIICTLSWYESLMANDSDTVFLIIKETAKKSVAEGRDSIIEMINLYNNGCSIKFKNDFLSEKSNKILNKLKEKINK